MTTLILSSHVSIDSVALREAALFGGSVFAGLVAKALQVHLLQTPLSWLAALPSGTSARLPQYGRIDRYRQAVGALKHNQ
jgi:hypothetical protein